MRTHRIAILTAALGVCLAATSAYAQRRAVDDAVTLRADLRILEERINGIAGNLQALQVNHDRMAQQVAALQHELAGLKSASGGAVTPQTISQLEQRISAVDAARKRDAELLVSQVTAELAKLSGGSTSSRKSSSSAATPAGKLGSKRSSATSGQPAAAGGTEQGYEHEVGKGQTLSGIAKTYGVTVDTIKKANNLKGDTVYAGQKLFVPKQ